MSKIIDFNINQKSRLRMVGEDELTSFSDIEIVFYYLNSKYIIYKDTLIECIRVMHLTLNKAVEFKLQADTFSKKKGMGFWWNEFCNKQSTENVDDDITAPFHLWSTDSTTGIDTWIYNVDKKIILEVSPTYRWHFDEPKCAGYITYEQFIIEYTPICILEIEINTVKEWIKMCKDIMSNN